jgi:hypothetical protein
MRPKMPKPPKPPKPPPAPQSPVDMASIGTRPDSTSVAYESLISSAPTGQRKAAGGSKKTLLGGSQ